MLLVRTVEGGWEAFNRGDLDVLELMYHPDVQFQYPEGTVGVKSHHRGREGFREFQADWADGWGEQRLEPRELIDLGDRFLVLGQLVARGASGVSLAQDHAMLATFDSRGRIIRQRDYFDHAEALKAMGLSE